ncbi:MAG: hypothetical protein M0Q91_11935 [Methanoregula sp.]|jgi:hypothetical protein|nr:hypothetical protein [Methanoregula sp.]
MAVSPENIAQSPVLQSERKLIRRMMAQNREAAVIFRQYADTTADILKRYRLDTTTLWNKSPRLRQEILSASQRLKTEIEVMVKQNTEWSWLLSNQKNDQIIQDYIDRLPLTGDDIYRIGTDQFTGEQIKEKIYRRTDLFAQNLVAYDQFVNRKVAGMGLSDRVWNVAKESQAVLEYYVESGIATGRSAQEMSRDIRQILNEPDKLFRRVRNPETGLLELSRPAKAYHPGRGVYRGVYRSAYKNALRLTRTETNMAYRAADHERWKKIDWILGYEVKLSNSHHIIDVCDSMAGRYPKEFRFIGFHPACLCYATPILPTQDEMLDNVIDGKPMDGMVGDVPDGFKSWVANNQDKVSKWANQPYFVRDNFRGGRIENGLKNN